MVCVGKKMGWLVMVGWLAVTVGCAGEAVDHEEERLKSTMKGGLDHQGEAEASVVVIDSTEQMRQVFKGGEARWERPKVKQVGLQWMEKEQAAPLEYRWIDDGEAGDWQAVEAYWSEGGWSNGHMVVEEGAQGVELRGGESLGFLRVQFYEQVQARDEIQRPGSGDKGVRQQAVAPSSMVTSRSEWGSIDPHRVCNNVVAPWRMSIHHTASPASDGGDPHARMRGMQSYHINSNGWCDIGYHFVVAQSGEIMQGRAHSDRPGAHVGGENSGNVGISMIGNYTSSTPPTVQVENMATIVQWVHEEHDIPLNRDAVRGHREWPGQTTSCPGDVGLEKIDEILDLAGDTAEYDVAMAVEVDGVSLDEEQGKPTGLPGDEVEIAIVVTNASTDPIRDVRLAVELDEVGLAPQSYRIESDHPAHDQSSWELNSAHDEEDNPDHESLSHRETLEMHAFSPQESKRVVIEATLEEYNVGRVEEFSGARAWVESMRDIYGDQEGYGESPSTNEVGALVQAAQSVAVLSREEWQFKAGQEEATEGWRGGGEYEDFRLNTSHDLLAQQMVEGEKGWAEAPEWMSVDADRYGEMVIRSRSHDGEHRVRVGFGDEAIEEEVEFVQPGDGEYHLAVVPLETVESWRGEMGALQVWMRDGEAAGGHDSGWYDIDYIYFQSQELGETSSVDLGVVEQEAVSLLGQEGGPVEDGRVVSSDFPGASGPGVVEVRSSGCQATGGQEGPRGWAGWLLALGLVGLIRWRRRRRWPDFQSG